MRAVRRSSAPLVLGLLAATCAPVDPLERDGLDPPRCETCRISITTMLQIGFLEAPVAPSSGVLLTLDSNRERFVLVALPYRSELHEFDVDGVYVRSTGQEGTGPAEYGYISAIAFDATDSLWVFDTGNGRADVLSSTLQHVRSVPLAGSVDEVLPLEDGTFLLRGLAQDSTGVYSVLRVLRRDGSAAPLLAQGEGPAGADPSGTLGALAHGRERREYWASASHAYAIELRTTWGEVRRTFTRSPPWFATFDAELLTRYPDFDLQPTILGMGMDFTGKLWVIGGAVERRLPAPPSQTGEPVSPDEWVDTVIEILDPADGALVTSMRFDHAPPRYLRDGLVYRMIVDADGLPWIDIARLEFIEF